MARIAHLLVQRAIRCDAGDDSSSTGHIVNPNREVFTGHSRKKIRLPVMFMPGACVDRGPISGTSITGSSPAGRCHMAAPLPTWVWRVGYCKRSPPSTLPGRSGPSW